MLNYQIQQVGLLSYYPVAGKYIKQLFHPRRIIIASKKKVVKFTINIPAQIFLLLLISGFILWSSYTVGRLIAANIALEEKARDLHLTSQLVTQQKLGEMLVSTLPVLPSAKDNKITLPNPDPRKVVMLEKKISELKDFNEEVAKRISTKTDGHIDNLENIVRQTGLNPTSIKQELNKNKKHRDAEGGPYIPSSLIEVSNNTQKMFDLLDELQDLRQIVASLPLSLPIKNAQAHSGFGHRYDPFNGNAAFHSGLDLAAPSNSEIYSTSDGVVEAAERDPAYGNMIDINHGFGIVTRYGHLKRINVKKGDKVKRGDIIGVQGSTGRSTGEHLHYEVRYNGQAINPQKFLQAGKLLEVSNSSILED